MAVGYEIEGDVFILRLEDAYEPEELLESCSRAPRDPRFTAPMRLIVDSRRSQTMLETELIRDSLKRLAQARVFRERVAHVASDALHQALGRMAESYAEIEGIEFRSFDDIDAARLWVLTENGED